MAPHRQQLLIFILELLSFFSSSVSVSVVSPTSSTQLHISRNTSTSSCNWDLPPPFDYSGAAINGFQVKCKEGKSVLQLQTIYGDEKLYELKGINVSEGYVTISSGPMVIACGNNTDYISGTGWIDLEGSPYSWSTRNKFTVIGCNSLILMGRFDKNDTLFWTSGCVPFCYLFQSITDGSCSGIGCCQTDIPRGMKTVDIHRPQSIDYAILHSISNFNNCSQAFFADQGSFHFKKDILHSNLSVETFHNVILEWAIGNKTCEEAKKLKSYACQNNSYCYDVHNDDGVGYRCNCSQGYMGNPYQKGGCTDIDECGDPSLNPCTDICVNTPGNVTCVCPRGKKGDGREDGNGCKGVKQWELGLGVGLATLFMLISGSLCSYWFLKKREMMKLKSKFFRQNGGILLQQQISCQGNETMKIFSFEELRKATANFSEINIIGQGGYGTVYKGVLPNQKVVAIKKSKLIDGSQVEQFINEIVIHSQINHRNVVRLLGCCLETQVPLLVYEFIANGSLFKLIHDKEHIFSLSWDARLRIAAETAGALSYLHSTTSIPIIHRDVKSANILLDESYTAKVSDFGASRSVPFDQTHVTTLVQGTLGYLDPEYFCTSQLTEKSDVYSFGVVLAELMTGEMPISFSRTEILRNLSSDFIDLLEENKLLKVMKGEILVEAGIEQIFSVAELVRRCLSLKAKERPTMKEVAVDLEGLRKFKKQQTIDQHKKKEEECLVGGAGPSNLNIVEVEMSRLFSLENHMIMSADSPR